MNAKELKARLLKKKKKEEPLNSSELLSTGSTLLNMACSGFPNGGFAKGKYYFFVGDSASGKTFLCLTCLAEASINSQFDAYRLIYDNAEDGAMMNITKFFGRGVASRMEPPASDNEGPLHSETIEDFYYNLDDAVEKDIPFIYILDSMDALSSQAEGEKFDDQKKAHRAGKVTAGSYGDGKAKKNSAGIRKALAGLRRSNSILIIINQTRDNIGFGFEKKTRSGGHALRFYATLEMWSSIKGKIKKTVKGTPRQIGLRCKVQIKKNRLNGKEREIELPIYHSYGIDDTASCIEYLIDEGHWSKKGVSVQAPEFKYKGKIEGLITQIEETNAIDSLRALVASVWNDIEEKCVLKRKKRYE